ncbi:hypothetical protein [Sorangium cellulosum]|uniref:hypothetical protein n=1 Tax=Sorangium cellulosum TaxID=56 RepID=UPI000AB8AFAF|nr:hypothetical protein [Sorangium cellulosum]
MANSNVDAKRSPLGDSHLSRTPLRLLTPGDGWIRLELGGHRPRETATARVSTRLDASTPPTPAAGGAYAESIAHASNVGGGKSADVALGPGRAQGSCVATSR